MTGKQNQPRVSQGVNRLARPGDEEGILEVLSGAFKGWPNFDIPVTPLDHLRWQLEGYVPQTELHYVADVDGKIAAAGLSCIRGAKLGDRQVTFLVGADGATHPDFQRRGLWSALRSHFRAQTADLHDFRVSTTTNPVIRRAHVSDQDGVELGNAVTILLKVIDSARLARMPSDSSTGVRRNAWLRRLAFGAIKLLGWVRSRRFKRHGQQRTWEVRRIACFDDSADDFWQEASRQFDFIAGRNRDYLNWRYCDPRGGDHRVLVATEEDRLLGYVVLRTHRGRGHILDILALPGRLDVVESLVEAALAAFVVEGVAAVQTWSSLRHPYNGVFARHGFVDSRKRQYLYFSEMRMPVAEFALLAETSAAVHITDGDLI